MTVTFFDGQSLPAAQLNTAFAGKVDVGGDMSLSTSLAGNGTVARTLRNRFADTINVLDFMPSAPNGSQDNSAFVQTTLNNAAGVARVFFPATAFPFLLAGVTIPSNSHLIIDGTLKLLAGGGGSVLRMSSANNVVIEGHGVIDGNRSNQSSAQHGIETGSATGLTIRGITVQNCFQSPIYLAASSDILIERCEIMNCGKPFQANTGTDGLWIRKCVINTISDSGILFYGGVTNSSITGCTVGGSLLHGIYITHDSGNSVACSGISIKSNILRSNGGCGVLIDKGTGGVGNHSALSIRDNRIYGNNTTNVAGYGGIRNVTASNIQIGDNQIQRNGAGANPTYSIYCAGSIAQILDNQITDEGQGSTVSAGIVLASSASNVLISGNQIVDDQGSPTMAYGLSGVCGAGVRIYDNSIVGMRVSKFANLTLANDTFTSETADTNVITIHGAFGTASAYCDLSTVVVTPTTGFSSVIPATCSTYLMTPAGTLDTGTLAFPDAPFPGQIVRILSTQIVTTLTLTPGAGQTVQLAPTSLAGNTGVSYIYNGSTWYRLDIVPGLASLGPATVRTVIQAGTITTTANDQIVVVNKTVPADTAVSLMSSPSVGQTVTIKDGAGNASVHPIVISPASGNIDGATSITIASNYASVTLTYSSNGWLLV